MVDMFHRSCLFNSIKMIIIINILVDIGKYWCYYIIILDINLFFDFAYYILDK